MTFLPIVTRELRIAARRKSTYRIRSWTAALAFGISCIFLVELQLFPTTRSAGATTFAALSICALILALFGGIFLGADCLSQERREGTLGLLFLTDLKGYDIVLGKFAAVSLNAFYGLVASFPILGLPLLAGGVTGGEFWRTSLTLANALFFSVAAAVWVSSRSNITSRSFINSFAVIVGMLLISVAAHLLVPIARQWAPVAEYVSDISPFTSFRVAAAGGYYYGAKNFWQSLAISNFTGWVLLGLAGIRLRNFRESDDAQRRSIFARDLLTYGRKRQRRNLEIDPIVWLLDDSRLLRMVVWIIAGLGSVVAIYSVKHSPNSVAIQAMYGSPFNFILKLLFAFQACRFFSEARQSGALELLFSTPLSLRGAIRGQWRALGRIFLIPTLLLVLVQTICTFWPTRGPDALMGYLRLWFLPGKLVLTNAADFCALGWFGMWAALTFRKPNLAVGATLLYILVLPTLFFCIPSLVVDVVAGAIAYGKLRSAFDLPQPVACDFQSR